MNGSHPQLINYSSFVNGLNHQTMMLFLPFVTIPVFVLCYVWIFHAPCAFKFSLWSVLCLPLSVSLVPSWFSPLCSSPSLPHQTSSLLSLLTCSSLVISVCVFSLCVSFTPDPVIVCIVFGCYFASRPHFVCFWFLYSALNEARFFFFSPDLASCLTAFGSTSPFILSFPLKT